MAPQRVGAEHRTVLLVPVGDDPLVEMGGQRKHGRVSKTPRAGRDLIAVRRTCTGRSSAIIASSNGADIRVRILALRRECDWSPSSIHRRKSSPKS